MEKYAIQFTDAIVLEPFLSLLPENILGSIPIVQDGAAILNNTPLTDFSVTNFTILLSISNWFKGVGVYLLNVEEPIIEISIESLATLVGFDSATDLLGGKDITTILGKTILDSPTMGLLFYTFNSEDMDLIWDNISIE